MRNELLLSEHGLKLVKTADGLIRSFVEGELDLASEQADVLFEQIRGVMEANAPVLHLFDGRNLTLDSLALRWKLAQHMKRQRPFIKKSAVVTESATTRTLASVVVRTSGRKNVRFFKSTEEAEQWLLDDELV